MTRTVKNRAKFTQHICPVTHTHLNADITHNIRQPSSYTHIPFIFPMPWRLRVVYSNIKSLIDKYIHNKKKFDSHCAPPPPPHL